MYNNIRVGEISLEYQSKCNRKCLWCSNSVLPERGDNKMPHDVFLKLLKSISDNRYYFDNDLVLAGCRYNEPFYDPKLAVNRLNMMKEMVPHASVRTNTNGDFLSKEVFDELRIDKLNILDYDFRGLEYGYNKLIEWGIKINSMDPKSMRISGVSKNGVNILYRTDFLNHTKLQDRAGTIKDKKFNWHGHDVEIKEWDRGGPCLMVLKTVSIDHTGDVFLCYNMRYDEPSHKEFIVGNIKDNNLIDILEGEKAKEVRQLANKWDNFPGPCAHCGNRRKPAEPYKDFYKKERGIIQL